MSFNKEQSNITDITFKSSESFIPASNHPYCDHILDVADSSENTIDGLDARVSDFEQNAHPPYNDTTLENRSSDFQKKLFH